MAGTDNDIPVLESPESLQKNIRKLSSVKQQVAEEIKSLKQLNHPLEQDPEFTPQDLGLMDSGKPRYKSIKDDVESCVIDELLAGVDRSQGYYLKLLKKVGPNEFQFKERIDNYESWSDLELEITNFVREKTLHAHLKWGTGLYRIVVWKDGGIRNSKYRPIDFSIDAQEENVIQPQQLSNNHIDSSPEAQLASLSSLVKTMKEVLPDSSPTAMLGSMTEAYKAGLGNNEGGGSMSQIIVPMMTMFMSSIAEMSKASNNGNSNQMDSIVGNFQQTMGGLLNTLLAKKEAGPEVFQSGFSQAMEITKAMNESKSKQPDTLSLIVQLREAGLIQTPAQPVSAISKFGEIKEIIEVMQGLGLGGNSQEKSTVLEKIIDKIAPEIPTILMKVTDTVNNAIELKKQKLNGSTVQKRRISHNAQEYEPSVNSMDARTGNQDSYKYEAPQRDYSGPYDEGDDIKYNPDKPAYSVSDNYQHSNGNYAGVPNTDNVAMTSMEEQVVSGEYIDEPTLAQNNPQSVEIDQSIDNQQNPEQTKAMNELATTQVNKLYSAIVTYVSGERKEYTDNRCQAIVDSIEVLFNGQIDPVATIGSGQTGSSTVLQLLGSFGGAAFKVDDFKQRFELLWPTFFAYVKSIFDEVANYIAHRCIVCGAVIDIAPEELTTGQALICGEQIGEVKCIGSLQKI